MNEREEPRKTMVQKEMESSLLGENVDTGLGLMILSAQSGVREQ
jgi:hypothetical protein